MAISQFIGRDDGDDPVDLLVGVARTDAAEGIGDWLGRIAFELATLVELRGQYPLLQYFHEPGDQRAVPVALSDLMELVTLCRSMLDPATYPALAEGPTVRAVERLGVHYLAGFAWEDARDEDVLREGRSRRYATARARLERAGIALRADPEARERFAAIMARWDVGDQHMREWLAYRPVDAGLAGPDAD